jgi:hypothetical protein
MRSQRKRYVHRTALLSLTAALVVGQPMAALAAPDNDDRANATPVTAIPFTDVVDVSDATVEDDEPGTGCLTFEDEEGSFEVPVGHTVWYEVSLRNRTQVLVDTEGSGFDTVAVVYDSDLNEIACNDDAGTLQAKVDFTAERGQTYLVKIGSFGDDIDEEYEDRTLNVSIDRGRVKTREINPTRQERYSFKGLQAYASNWWYDEGEDWETFGGEGVGIVQGRQQDSWSRGNNRIEAVDVYSYETTRDFEKQTETWTDWWGYEELTNGNIDRRLRDAYVDQDAWVEGWSCTGPLVDWEELDDDEWVEYDCTELGSGTVRATVDWTGYGATTRSSGRGRYQDEWGTETYRYRARERSANVVGGVTGEVLSFDLTGAEGYLADVQDRFTVRYARR